MRKNEKYYIEHKKLCLIVLLISRSLSLGFFLKHALQNLKGNFSKEKWNKIDKIYLQYPCIYIQAFKTSFKDSFVPRLWKKAFPKYL